MNKEYSSTTDREVYVNKTVERPTDDNGTGWAVALIVLILAIGFGFVAFSNNQAASELRTSQSLEELRRDNQSLSTNIPQIVPPAAAPSNNIEVKVPEIKVPEVKAPEAEPQQVDVNVNTPAPSEPAEAE